VITGRAASTFIPSALLSKRRMASDRVARLSKRQSVCSDPPRGATRQSARPSSSVGLASSSSFCGPSKPDPEAGAPPESVGLRGIERRGSEVQRARARESVDDSVKARHVRFHHFDERAFRRLRATVVSRLGGPVTLP